MSSSRRAVGRWRSAVAGVVLAVSPLTIAACGGAEDEGSGVQQNEDEQQEEDQQEEDEDQQEEDEDDEG